LKIIYIHQYFKPNEGVRSFEFIKHLLEKGHEVTAITAEYIDPEFKMDGLTVVSTNTKYNNNMSKMQRIFAFVRFMIKGTFKGLGVKKPDVVFATSTPLTVGFPAVIIKKFKRCKMVFEVRDVWPDIPIEMGFIKGKFTKWALKKYEKWVYKNSAHIIPLSKGMYENIKAKGVAEEKLTTIENISNLYLYSPIKTILENRKNEPFVCIHPGTMGIVNGLDFVLDTAKIVAEKDKDIKFLLVGEGNRKEALKKRVEEEQITNVEIRDGVPKREVALLTEQASVGFMCVDTKYKILEDNSANKFFDFLAAGLPVVINYGGWQKEVVLNDRCGFSETEPEKMAEKLCEMKNNKELLREYAVNSKKSAEKYSTQEATKKLDIILENITKNAKKAKK